MSVHKRAQEAELERLEVEYAKETGGEALITDQEQGTTCYTFADGGTATNTDDAIKAAAALVRFAKNQKEV